jgi:hypothetical protein
MHGVSTTPLLSLRSLIGADPSVLYHARRKTHVRPLQTAATRFVGVATLF